MSGYCIECDPRTLPWLRPFLQRVVDTQQGPIKRLALEIAPLDVISISHRAYLFGCRPDQILAYLWKLVGDGLFVASDLYDGDLCLVAAIHPGPAGIPLQ
jgi:hypothetical protein